MWFKICAPFIWVSLPPKVVENETRCFSKQTPSYKWTSFAVFALACFSCLSHAQVKPTDVKQLAKETPSSAQPLTFSAQDKLDAIRQGLVEAALDSLQGFKPRLG